MSNQILVTGGAGFIGSSLVDRLIDEGFDVVVFDNLSTGNVGNIRRQLDRKRARFVKGDIRDYEAIKTASRGVESVFHLAGIANVGWSFQNPTTTHQVNAVGTLNVLRASLEAGVAKVIFTSSCAIYGNSLRTPISEDHPARPTSPYAASKLAGEGYLRAFASSFGIASVSFRLFNVYGPRQRDGDSGGVIARFANKLAKGIPPVIYGDGEQRRDFVFVKDVIDALVGARNGQGSEVYNIGSGRSSSLNELLDLLRHILGKEEVQAEYHPAKVGDIRESVADINKATSQLGYRPTISLEEGLRSTMHEKAILGLGSGLGRVVR